MNIKAEEISKIIRDQIGSYAVDVDVAEVGTIVSIGDGIARVHGVENTMAGEMLEFPHGVYGIALNLEEDSVGAVLLVWAAAVGWASTKDSPGLTSEIALANIGWVAASVVFLVVDDLTGLGIAFVVAQAAAVAGFVVLQLAAVRGRNLAGSVA